MSPRLESFCAQKARLANAPLVGTAPRVDIWLMLEYPRPWGDKALAESHIPEPVKQFLSEQAAAIPNPRILLIKHRSRDDLSGLIFSVVRSQEVNPVCYTFELPRYEALLDLDLSAVVDASPAYDSHIAPDPLYLVCTNGRRDACCASRGLHIYETLSEQVGPPVWQTTHVGGHRFAGNLVCLPHGVYYGRVDDFDPVGLIREYEQRHLFTSALRGRCCYEPVVQAAEHFLHTQSTGLEVDWYRLDRVEETASNQWVICFAERDGALHTLTLTVELSDEEVQTSCGSDKKKSVTRYHMEEYRLDDL